MTPEIYTTLSIILILWAILTVADAAVSGILKLAAGIRFRKAFVWGLLSLLIPPVAIAYGGLIERNIFKIKDIEITFSGLPADFDGYRIVQISDLHARSFEGRPGRLQKAVDKINSLEPDLIAFTGDLISMDPAELDGLADILKGLEATDGTYSVLGNHDYCLYSDLDEEGRSEALRRLIALEKEMGWTLLMNESRTIRHKEDSIAVIGVENTSPSRHFPSRGDLVKASDGTDGMFRILLSHDPLHWESEIIGKDYPLTLSGHTHAMQLSILGWCPSRYIFPQYRGLYSAGISGNRHTGPVETRRPKNGCQDAEPQYLYVNTGLGETIFPARIGVMPEITLITLHSN